MIVSVLDNVNDDVGSVLDGGVLIGVVVVVGDGFGDSDGCVWVVVVIVKMMVMVR